MVFYWFAHHMVGDNGQDIGAHPNFGFLSSLFWVCLSVVCVLVKGETLLHRACKRNQVETVLQILALPGTDINVKGKTFSLLSVASVSPSSDCTPTVCSRVSKKRLTWGGNKIGEKK